MFSPSLSLTDAEEEEDGADGDDGDDEKLHQHHYPYVILLGRGRPFVNFR